MAGVVIAGERPEDLGTESVQLLARRVVALISGSQVEYDHYNPGYVQDRHRLRAP